MVAVMDAHTSTMQACRDIFLLAGVERDLLEAVYALLDSEPEDIPGAADEVRDAVHEYVKAMGQDER